MIEHVWSVLCFETVIDKASNKISLHSIAEQVQIMAKPMPKGILPIHLDLVSLWIRSDSEQPESGISRITFVSPSAKVMAISEPNIDLLKTERARNVVQFEGIPLEESGRYLFRVELKSSDDEWLQVASVPLSVTFAPPESPQDEVVATMESS